MLKYSEERHSKQGTKRERIVFAPQLFHYMNLTRPQSYSIIHSHKLLGSLHQGELGFPTRVPMDSPAAPKWKAKFGLEEGRDQPLHTHSSGWLLMRSVGTGTNCLSQIKSDSVVKALFSLSLILEKLMTLFKEPSSVLILCVPDKKQSSQSIGSLLGFFG